MWGSGAAEALLPLDEAKTQNVEDVWVYLEQNIFNEAIDMWPKFKPHSGHSSANRIVHPPGMIKWLVAVLLRKGRM